MYLVDTYGQMSGASAMAANGVSGIVLDPVYT
jgi:hypothetical protein